MEEQLILSALQARLGAYTPYSHYKVGAAILCKDGTIITGCNIENATYGATNCAERTAFFKAVSVGYRDFEMIAIVGGQENETELTDYAYPCGICRQVMREFCNPVSFKVIVAKSVKEYKVFKLKELLPNSFGPEHLL